MGTHPIFESDFDCLTEMTKIEIERDEYVKLKADLDLAAQNGLKLLKENINFKSEAKTKKEEVTSLQNLLEKANRRLESVLAENADDISATRSEFENEITNLSRLSESQKEKIASQRSEIVSLNQINDREIAKNTKLSEELKRLQDQKVSEDKPRDTYSEDYEKLLSKYQDSNERNEEILQRLDLAQTEVINSVNETKKLTLEKESIQASLNELKENYLRKEDELVDLRERMDELEFEKQELLASASTKGPSDIATAGNSLFSEVEDRRRLTAHHLAELENTYKDKISRHDALVEDNKKLTAENYVLNAKLSKSLASEEHNKRLISEIEELRSARDDALSQVESLSFILSVKNSDADENNEFTVQNRLKKQLVEKDKELVTLNSTIKNLMLDKCGLSDRLRKVDIRLAEKEKQVVALEQKLEKSFESTGSKENEPEDPMSPEDLADAMSILNALPKAKTEKDRKPSEDLSQTKERVRREIADSKCDQGVQ